jgi:hypothetical protein
MKIAIKYELWDRGRLVASSTAIKPKCGRDHRQTLSSLHHPAVGLASLRQP